MSSYSSCWKQIVMEGADMCATRQRWEDAFREEGILIRVSDQGVHLRLPSGMHTADGIFPEKLLATPSLLNEAARALAQRVAESLSGEPDVVMGPPHVGNYLALCVAVVLSARFVPIERASTAGDSYRPVYAAPHRDARVLLVDGIIQTGYSVHGLQSSFHGWNICGVASLIRQGSGVVFSVPTVSLVTIPLKVYSPEKCPLCAKKVPLANLREFLERRM